jgi:hypothetical protein
LVAWQRHGNRVELHLSVHGFTAPRGHLGPSNLDVNLALRPPRRVEDASVSIELRRYHRTHVLGKRMQSIANPIRSTNVIALG